MPRREVPFSWACSFCNSHATIQNVDYISTCLELAEDNADPGRRAVELHSIRCPNSECGRVTVWGERSVLEFEYSRSLSGPPTHGRYSPNEVLQSWNLIPPSEAKAFPEYVPEPIREDYQEACLIRDLSPKASATLSRRCLQGMIRHYWEVSDQNLKQAINAIKDKVDPLTWQAIEAVRTIGNIGAHMEKDINAIVEVDLDEARQLIELVEQLIQDWYILRHQHQGSLNKIIESAANKQTEQKNLQSD